MPPVLLLAIAIVLEIIATTSLKLSEGLSKPAWAAVVVAGYAGSFFLLSKALQTIPIGWAYAVWSGVGTVGTALIGLALFGEAFTAVKAAGIAAIVGGVILLNIGGAH